MNIEQEQKIRKRTIKNISQNNTVANEIEQSPNPEYGGDIQLKVENRPDIQINDNNLEPSPAPLSSEQILVSPHQNQMPQFSINNNLNINTVGQFQQIPNRNSYIVANQMIPQMGQNGIIIIRQFTTAPVIQNTHRYTPIISHCPYCQMRVTTDPYISWSSRSGCLCFGTFTLYIISFFLCLFLDLCCMACEDGDYCWYEAEHRCPNCKNIIARRNLKSRIC